MVSAVGENILTKECVSDIQQAKKFLPSLTTWHFENAIIQFAIGPVTLLFFQVVNETYIIFQQLMFQLQFCFIVVWLVFFPIARCSQAYIF